MKLIIDSNRMLSALISDGTTRKLISSDKFEFSTLNYVTAEVMKYKEYILSKSGMDEKELELLFNILLEKIEIVPDVKVLSKMSEAKSIMKDIDIHDSPILACALAVQNDGIWSDDKDFDRQNKVKVWKTKDLLKQM